MAEALRASEETEEPMIMFVRYRYREPNGLIKLEAAAGSLAPKPTAMAAAAAADASLLSLSLSLLSPSRSASIRHRLRRATHETLSAPAAADGMCACKSPISFAHFLHFKIRSAEEGEREGEGGSKCEQNGAQNSAAAYADAANTP